MLPFAPKFKKLRLLYANIVQLQSMCMSNHIWLSPQLLPWIWKDKTLMTLIQQAQTPTHLHMHMFTTPRCSHNPLFPSVCLHYIMERVVRGSVDPSNLISHCGRTAYIRSSGTEREREGESGVERKGGAGDLNAGWVQIEMKLRKQRGNRFMGGWAMGREKWEKNPDERRERSTGWWESGSPTMAPSGVLLALYCPPSPWLHELQIDLDKSSWFIQYWLTRELVL